TFRGERHDLEEMVGNLVDNACKWADRQVLVTVRPESAETAADRAFFTVAIDDDGPGLSADEREAVGRRGRRLDETKPG
ncbi:ATP-binding protein, partial [Acinetobacter baumannii]|uniref:ATP-binding protein n=1 Tax=Acinetobacter baumannii TaxID=470 RepID=UPI0020902BE2